MTPFIDVPSGSAEGLESGGEGEKNIGSPLLINTYRDFQQKKISAKPLTLNGTFKKVFLWYFEGYAKCKTFYSGGGGRS